MSKTLLAASAAIALLTTGGVISSPAQADQPGLKQVAAFQHQVTGVTVTKDNRIFVNFPRWTEDTEVSVAELKDGKPVPYPDTEWNAWRNALKDKVEAKNHFVCVQSVVADHAGNLWVVDAGAPAMAAEVPGAPKLVKIDTKTNKVLQTIPINDSVAPQGSYLNDVRFSPDDSTAYLTDSGAKGALIVVDTSSGAAHRVLDGYPQTQPDPNVVVTYDGKPLRRPDGRGVDFSADGIALSKDSKTLYWPAIKGKSLYSLPTDALTGISQKVLPESLSDKVVAGKVVTVGENGPADGLLIGQDGKMYISGPEDNTVKVRDLSGQGTATPTVLIKDGRLRWPDTFSQGPDGTVYITTSHIQDSAFYKQGAPIALPTELWSFKPAGK